MATPAAPDAQNNNYFIDDNGQPQEITVAGSRRKKPPPNSPPVAPTNTFNVSDFLSIVGQGLSKSNKFKVTISMGENTELSSRWSSVLRDFSFFCDAAEFPGRTLSTTDVKIHGPTFKSPNLSQYSDVTLTILCDPAFSQKTFFEDWLHYINPEPSFFFRYRNSYIGTVDITQYDEFGEPSYTARLKEAYPVVVNPLSASWADDGFHRLQVVFTYRYWTYVDNAGQEVRTLMNSNILDSKNPYPPLSPLVPDLTS